MEKTEQPNAEHDFLTKNQIEQVAQCARMWIRDGGHASIYCSPVKFQDWFKVLQSVAEENGVVFKVDLSPMVMVNEAGHYFGNARKKTNALHSLTMWAIHATKRGFSNTL